MNQVCIIGRLTREPELRYGNSGTAVAQLSVAVDGAGDKDESDDGKWGPGYFEVTVFGTQAENCAQYLIKGQQVGVTGSLSYHSWKDKETDKTRSRVEIKGFRVDFLAKPRGAEDDGRVDDAPVSRDYAAPAVASAPVDDDIPF